MRGQVPWCHWAGDSGSGWASKSNGARGRDIVEEDGPARFRGIGRAVVGVGVMMLLCFANRLLGEPVLVSGGELVVVVEASFEL